MEMHFVKRKYFCPKVRLKKKRGEAQDNLSVKKGVIEGLW